jgi:hypothetical protein
MRSCMCALPQIYRLLSGRVELWELIMTGGLWRRTGQQVAAAAAALGERREVVRAAMEYHPWVTKYSLCEVTLRRPVLG